MTYQINNADHYDEYFLIVESINVFAWKQTILILTSVLITFKIG